MVAFGLLLLLIGLVAGAFAIWVAMAGAAQSTVEGAPGMGVDIAGNTLVVQTLTLVILGIAGLVLILFGLWLMVAASKRKMREARERRAIRKTQKQQERDLADGRRADTTTTTATRPQATTGRGHLDRDGVVDERSGRPVADGTEYEPGSHLGRDDRIPPVDGPGRR
ncbi:hypothetical protein [Mobilicoccus pelagius]|uniref:Uncharacterized protein n=1 Tax=Mobilicoccus pelagius NBRC 104925 TaxID=1089455 RepID=H5UPN5_9MICO|nr:hypothetical protein [Mobilicoccus pelagius]GAB47693.1 hypothetical protein MOPEL_027_00040 [Mobilicoccus pelagius NBRC 104925]